MKYHDLILLLLSGSVLAYFKPLRKPLELLFPGISIIGALLSKEYVTRLGWIQVELSSDSKVFMIASSLVFLMVSLWNGEKRRDFSDSFLFLTSLSVLNLVFISRDLFNVYVLLEVLSIQAGIMILKKKDATTLWATLKYLLVGGVGANLFLVGVAMIYSKTGRLDMGVMISGPAASFILVGLLMRLGSFGIGMWLPQFHSSAPDDLSALLSGAFINATAYVLGKLNLDVAYLRTLFLALSYLSLAMVVLPSKYKVTLAGSTMVHAVLIPITSPLYALSHSVSKATLFLLSEKVRRGKLGALEAVAFFVAAISLAGGAMTIGRLAKPHDILFMVPSLVSASFVVMGRKLEIEGVGKLWVVLPLILLLSPGWDIASLTAAAVVLISWPFKRRWNLWPTPLERLEVNLATAAAALAGVMILG